MPRFAANLTMMFNEWSFLDRFDAAAEAGFTAVEFLFPYEHPPEAIAERLERNKLTPALFNLPPGDWNAGERGMASHPHRFAELQDRQNPEAVTAFRRAVEWTAGELAQRDLTLVLEPINPRDMPGYFLGDFDFAERLIQDLALPNLKLQFDLYHRQIVHGDVTMALRRTMPMIGHVQIASVPSRHEPSDEELNFPFLFAELDLLGYDGFVGCEYRPRAGTVEGLGWFAPYKGARP
jgi:hydroxypyruvate isomerase